MKRYRFLPSARGEYEEAIRWYAARSAVAPDFVSTFEQAIRRIRTRPKASPAWPGIEDVRRYVLRRFPYLVVYLIEPTEVVIVAVAHSRRKPGYWLRRVPRRNRRAGSASVR